MNLLKNGLLLLMVLMSISSCKENSAKNINNTELNQQAKNDTNQKDELSNFSLTVRALFEKDDVIEIYFIQDNSENYTTNLMLLQEVKGSDQFQDVKFNLAPEYYPFNFRMDLGNNAQQNLIKIEGCTLQYGNSTYVINGKKLHDYFIFNDGVETHSDSMSFRLKTFKEGNIDKYDPFLMGNQNLNDVFLKKL